MQTTGQKYHQIFKIDDILEFHDHIWNRHGKFIQKSTNMPGIGSLICEIDVNISEIWESKHNFAWYNQRALSKRIALWRKKVYIVGFPITLAKCEQIQINLLRSKHAVPL